jgi:transposase-like protein
MATAKKASATKRRSVSLSREVDSQVTKLARRHNLSANRVLEDLIQAGLEAKEAERRRFFELAQRLRTTTDESEAQNLKEELARATFGV